MSDKPPNYPFSREAGLTSADVTKIVNAVGHAYPQPQMLYLRLRQGMAFDPEYEVGGAGTAFKLMIDGIGRELHAQNKLLAMLALVLTDNREGNATLAELAAEFFDDVAAAKAVFAAPAAVETQVELDRSEPALQKVVHQQSRLLDLPAFIRGLEQLSGAICRIDTPSEVGSGFLIGPQTVLTNYHVMKDAILAQTGGADILCNFDYKSGGQAVVRTAAAGFEWHRLSSPYSHSDETAQGDPAPNELDFAVVRLATPFGPERQPLALPVPSPVVTPLDYVVIGQHPGGEQQELSFGQIVELPGSGLRYRYDATTEPGSSGSPVLDISLRLIGLHHAADINPNPKYNQGVPIAVIMKAVKAAECAII